MRKLLVFDIDGTLAPYGRPFAPETAAALRLLEERGAQIAIASGKSVSYIEGLCRGVGLSRAVCIGENGAALLYRRDTLTKVTGGRPAAIVAIEDALRTSFPALVFQDNFVNVTVFPQSAPEHRRLLSFIEDRKLDRVEGLQYYTHLDCVEWTPEGTSKAVAVRIIQREFGFSRADTLCAGDGENDRPMAGICDSMLVVGDGLQGIRGARRFGSTADMLSHLLKISSEEEL